MDNRQRIQGMLQEDTEYVRVRELGMTHDEALAHLLIGEAAYLLMHVIEPMHPMERTETATELHHVQDIMFKRVTYRRYLQSADLDPHSWWEEGATGDDA